MFILSDPAATFAGKSRRGKSTADQDASAGPVPAVLAAADDVSDIGTGVDAAVAAGLLHRQLLARCRRLRPAKKLDRLERRVQLAVMGQLGHSCRGTLAASTQAVQAMRAKKPLLVGGLVAQEGAFTAGDVVRVIANSTGLVVGVVTTQLGAGEIAQARQAMAMGGPAATGAKRVPAAHRGNVFLLEWAGLSPFALPAFAVPRIAAHGGGFGAAGQIALQDRALLTAMPVVAATQRASTVAASGAMPRGMSAGAASAQGAARARGTADTGWDVLIRKRVKKQAEKSTKAAARRARTTLYELPPAAVSRTMGGAIAEAPDQAGGSSDEAVVDVEEMRLYEDAEEARPDEPEGRGRGKGRSTQAGRGRGSAGSRSSEASASHDPDSSRSKRRSGKAKGRSKGGKSSRERHPPAVGPAPWPSSPLTTEHIVPSHGRPKRGHRAGDAAALPDPDPRQPSQLVGDRGAASLPPQLPEEISLPVPPSIVEMDWSSSSGSFRSTSPGSSSSGSRTRPATDAQELAHSMAGQVAASAATARAKGSSKSAHAGAPPRAPTAASAQAPQQPLSQTPPPAPPLAGPAVEGTGTPPMGVSLRRASSSDSPGRAAGGAHAARSAGASKQPMDGKHPDCARPGAPHEHRRHNSHGKAVSRTKGVSEGPGTMPRGRNRSVGRHALNGVDSSVRLRRVVLVHDGGSNVIGAVSVRPSDTFAAVRSQIEEELELSVPTSELRFLASTGRHPIPVSLKQEARWVVGRLRAIAVYLPSMRQLVLATAPVAPRPVRAASSSEIRSRPGPEGLGLEATSPEPRVPTPSSRSNSTSSVGLSAPASVAPPAEAPATNATSVVAFSPASVAPVSSAPVPHVLPIRTALARHPSLFDDVPSRGGDDSNSLATPSSIDTSAAPSMGTGYMPPMASPWAGMGVAPLGPAGIGDAVSAAGLPGARPVAPNFLFLASSPLVRDTGEPAGELLAHGRELSALLSAVRDSRKLVIATCRTATRDELRLAAVRGVSVLYYSGHGDRSADGLLAEKVDDVGKALVISGEELRELFIEGQRAPRLVFVSACHSRSAGEAFVDAGCPHVVAVDADAAVTETSALLFSRAFFSSLLCGLSVRRAFNLAKQSVARSDQANAGEQASVFVLLPPWPAMDYGSGCIEHSSSLPASFSSTGVGGGGTHRTPAWGGASAQGGAGVSAGMGVDPHSAVLFPEGSVPDGVISEVPPGLPLGGQGRERAVVPSLPEEHIPRNRHLYQLLHTLMRSRLVSVTGARGAGKSTMLRAAVVYLSERPAASGARTHDGVHYLRLTHATSAESLVMALLDRFVSLSQDTGGAGAGEDHLMVMAGGGAATPSAASASQFWGGPPESVGDFRSVGDAGRAIRGATAHALQARRARAEAVNASGGSSTSSRSVSSSARTAHPAACGADAEPLWAAWATREAVLKRMRLAQLLERLLEDCPGLRIAVGATMPVSVSEQELDCLIQKRRARRHRRAATGRSAATSTAASGGTGQRPEVSTTDSGDADGDALRHARLHIGPDGDVEYSVPALSSVEAGRLLAHLSARHARVVTMEEVFIEISGREPQRPAHAPVEAWPQIRQALACREAGDAVACVLPLTPAVISEVARRLGSAAKPVPLLVAIRRVAKALANDRRVTECVGAVAAQRLKLQGRSAAALACFPEPLEDAGGQASQAAVGSGGGALVVLAAGQPASAAVVEPVGMGEDAADAADADEAGAELRGAHPWLAAMSAPPPTSV
ncbi:hypothetical protein FNF28_01899 [Cafeteria roenbergensis]|uniref:Uncharacterized protein n=1 Tax=Cafeteria roenbergensis TaxID=33653 RepID=A0A5A8E126_CAFRO|nr:hypothetical protein FNF28_01899 [Cafeteria roenbergensis]